MQIKCFNGKKYIYKNSGGLGSGRNCRIFRQVCLKVPRGLRTYAGPPTLGFITRTGAGSVSVAHVKWEK